MSSKKQKELSVPETAEWLRTHDKYLIITHRRPDGDTLGCAAALTDGLRSLGKTVYMLNNPETTARFLPYVQDYWAPDDFTPDEIITVDTASPNLFPENAEKYADSISLCIDHHPSNTGYARYACIDGTRAAGGEVLYEILIALSGTISKVSAACLYIALSTDTGCFAFANTTANTLRIAALTVEAGAPLRELNRIFFRTKTRARIELEGLILSQLEFFYDNRVAVSTITREMMDKTGCTENDINDIASLPGSVEGVLVGITIRELSNPEDCKVSVRTSPQVSANELCSQFGGGGHPMAAGFSRNETVSDLKIKIVNALLSFMPDVEQ